MRHWVRILVKTASSLVLLAFLYAIYWTFNAYDWNYPLHKLACFTTLFVVVTALYFIKAQAQASANALWVEAGVLAVVVASLFAFNASKYGKFTFQRPASDIGYTTIKAVEVFVREYKNPYSHTDVTFMFKALGDGYKGYHYGPGMLIGYLPSAWFPIVGYRVANLVYFLASIVLLILLIRRQGEPLPQRAANILFVLAAYIMAERFWIEILPEGANDLFHIMFILAALLAFKHDKIFLTGVLIGFSMAGKFAPGLFLIPFMPLRDKWFWFGLAAGLTPYIPFVFWDAAALWRNVFWLRVAIPPDWTSLYWITPKPYHWVYGAISLAAFLFALIASRGRKHSFDHVLVGFTLLLIVSDVVQKQVHGNHLIWFYPLFAMLFMNYRERLFALVAPSPAEASA